MRVEGGLKRLWGRACVRSESPGPRTRLRAASSLVGGEGGPPAGSTPTTALPARNRRRVRRPPPAGPVGRRAASRRGRRGGSGPLAGGPRWPWRRWAGLRARATRCCSKGWWEGSAYCRRREAGRPERHRTAWCGRNWWRCGAAARGGMLDLHALRSEPRRRND
jgi:hypothetical protein